VSTKPGTNEFHGAAFEFLRNSALDARQWLQSNGNKNPFRRNQFGFTLGGPVWIPEVFNGRNSLFFMSNLRSRHWSAFARALSSTMLPAIRRLSAISTQFERGVHRTLTLVHISPVRQNLAVVRQTLLKIRAVANRGKQVPGPTSTLRVEGKPGVPAFPNASPNA
jgi:hypothetical protein